MKGGPILKSNNVLRTRVRGLLIRSVYAAAALLFIPVATPAATVIGDSSTYLQSRETADSNKILGVYEYLDFALQDIGNEAISFHTGGWLRYDLKEEEFEKRSNSDLQYSYLSFRSKTDNTVVNLGRVMVFEGVAAERVDGLYARTDLKAGFGISGFGGNTVDTGSDLPGNNVIYGGRLFHEWDDVYRIGLSALKEEKDSQDYRREEGIDIWVHPIDKVDLTGRSSYNDVTKGWMEHSYALMMGPFEKLRLTASASAVNYDDYFYGATMSAFTVQSDLIQPNEKVRTLGGEASYPITDAVMIIADYKNYNYEIAGKADYLGGKLKYSLSEVGGVGIGIHSMVGDTNELKYNEYRVYGYKKFGHLDVSADVIDVAYVNAINGVKDSYAASLAAQYDLAEAWKLGADAEYSHNPDFDKDIRVFFKVLYHFGTKGGA
jgi:hypothetical protein